MHYSAGGSYLPLLYHSLVEDKGRRTSHKILYFNALGSKVHEKREILNVKYSM